MKVIIGSESFAPNISGVATVTELLAKNLTEEGHEVYVFAPSRSFLSYVERHPAGFRVVRFRSLPNPFRRGFRISFLPRRVVFRQVRKIKPDLIHLQDPTSTSSALLKASKKFGIPIVISNHFSMDYILTYLWWLRPFQGQLHYFFRHYFSNFYNQCDHIICPTETVKGELKSWGITKPIDAISNGIDLDRFFVHTNPVNTYLRYQLPQNPIVLFVGRLDKDKKVEVFIRAIPEILKKVNAHFVVVGSGSEQKKMQKLARKLQLDRYLTWTGWLDNKNPEFIDLYKSASVFVITSTIETQSLVTMEAMASGLPVVGPDSGALPELIKHGENGFLFEPNNSSDLAQKAVTILSDRMLRERMRKSSLEIISQHQIVLSLEKIKKIYAQLYRDH